MPLLLQSSGSVPPPSATGSHRQHQRRVVSSQTGFTCFFVSLLRSSPTIRCADLTEKTTLDWACAGAFRRRRRFAAAAACRPRGTAANRGGRRLILASGFGYPRGASPRVS